MHAPVALVLTAAVAVALCAPADAAPTTAAPSAPPPSSAADSPDARALRVLGQMSFEEKIALLHGPMAIPRKGANGALEPAPSGAVPSAGYVPGLPRLGIPALYETDAGLGVGNPGNVRPGDVATALPSSLALAAAFDPDLARRAGVMVGSEARAKGFNVLLGGGMNLARDPRNGRNFEYLGEDPLLAGLLAGAEVAGVQSEHVISTVKHFALNANETNRQYLDARIDPAALRESDLLAFELALETGRPGAVMCSYNLINGVHTCANHWLLADILKRDWQYPGWVMSDWGAVHDATDATAGLDQESGEQEDREAFFGAALARAVATGAVAAARIDDMAHRILRSMFAVGIVDDPHPGATIDYAAHAAVALEVAQKGIVLLKNEGGILPLGTGVARIAIIGGHANAGVLSGGGSAQVLPANAKAAALATATAPDCYGQVFDPSAPFDALQQALPGSTLRYDSGAFPARSAALAAHSDLAVVFVTRHEHEGGDIPDLDLPDGQGALIEAVARANPRTIVVLETGNPVSMPWIDRVPAVLAAWYPGQEGGRAIADILVGAVNPSGRLPLTFPRVAADSVRPALPNLGVEPDARVHVDYTEGAEVGYRWYAAHGVAPLFAFGHGLSFTRFDYADLKVTGGARLAVSVAVRNVGERAGADVVQVYLTAAAGTPMLRLIGFRRVDLAPGERRTMTFVADPRLLGSFDERRGGWQVKAGTYRVSIGRSAADLSLGGDAHIAAYTQNYKGAAN